MSKLAFHLPAPLDAIVHPLIEGGILVLPVSKDEEFTPIWDSIAEDTIVHGYNSTIFVRGAYRYGFEVASKEGRYSTYEIFRSLYQLQSELEADLKTLQIDDYLVPEDGQEFSPRQMVFLAPPRVQGASFVARGERLTQGFTMRLSSVALSSQGLQ